METIGGVNTDRTWDIMMKKARFGNLYKPSVTVDRESFRNIYYQRAGFTRLAYALLAEGRRDSAVQAADRCQQMFPPAKCGYDYFQMQMLEIYFRGEAIDKGVALASQLTHVYKQNINYYLSTGSTLEYWQDELGKDINILQRISAILKRYKQEKAASDIESFIYQKTKSLK
jgi:hypothetical protein